MRETAFLFQGLSLTTQLFNAVFNGSFCFLTHNSSQHFF
jgi:hypothetical protein